MNKKTIIEIVVVVGAFIASGIVLYNGFFSGSSAPPAVVPGLVDTTGTAASQNILPYGATFDLDKFDSLVKARNFKFGNVSYPILSTSTEVGKLPVSNLIVPPPSSNP